MQSIHDQFNLSVFAGAYYISKLPGLPIRMMQINTNLYYDSNKLTADMEDPADQFHWLENEFNKAATANEKVQH